MGRRQRESIASFQQGWINGGSKNQNATEILGFTSLGTRAGPALWGEGFILESSRFRRNEQSQLVSHLQLHLWPLEGVGPKLQGSGPESCRFMGSSGILECSAVEG